MKTQTRKKRSILFTDAHKISEYELSGRSPRAVVKTQSDSDSPRGAP